ncbi:MAG: glycosyltransferase, partial [Clostridia bacterium]|nr:glycosyltransferase [Clostridia bacterium]
MKKGTKILMALMQFDIGGAETHVVELSKELVRRGYEVVIASNGGAYESEVEAAGIKHYKVPLQNKNPFNVIKAYKTLKSIITAEKIDIVHSHARIPSFILGKLKNKMNFPFVTSAHWVFSTKYGLKYITDWGERTVAVSDDIKKYLIDNYGYPEENIFVTINGIDLNKFSADTPCDGIRAEFGISSDDFCIVGISRMDKDRSLASKQLIKLAPRLKKEIPNLKILVVGGGNDEAEARMLAEEANKSCGGNTVILTGARVDINKLVAVSSLFVGVSRAALEAMASGKNTIVAGNEGYIGLFDESCLDVGIKTNFCCRGCMETTEDRIFDDIMKYLAKSSAEKAEMSDYCRKTVADYYSVEKMTNDYIRAYESLPGFGK